MASPFYVSSPLRHSAPRRRRALTVQDDDIIWTEYLKVASDADAHLVKEWSSVIDAVLVFVALFSGVLTAFIIQTADKFQPPPGEVTNRILIAIYNRTMNASAPIDLEKFLKIDDGSRRLTVYQNWLLYTSLTISILVAALAMAAKLWVVRYSREVTTSGPPRASAKRRQEVYEGLVAWRMQNFIDATPLLALAAVLFFVFFIHSSVPVQQAGIAYFVSVVFNIGFAFIIICSFSAAFSRDSPFRSPFSDLVGSIPKIIPNKPIPAFISIYQAVTWRMVGIIFSSVSSLAVGGYFNVKGRSASFPCVYWAIGGVFALAKKGEEKDMPPRLFDLPLWCFLSSSIVFACFMISFHFNVQHSTPLCIAFFALGSLLGIALGILGIKMSGTKPNTVEAEAVAWLLKTSTNKDPAWFQKAVQIAGDSDSARALLVEKLLPLLLPLITSLPYYSGQGDVTPEQESYINTLAVLMDFKRRGKSFRRNAAALERPDLPEELIDRLEKLQLPAEECLHKENSKEKWNDGSLRCPNACVNDAVQHLLQLHARRLSRAEAKSVGDKFLSQMFFYS